MTTAPLKFPRSLDAIVLDMRRTPLPRKYDDLLAEYERHPEVVAVDAINAQQDAIDSLVAEQEQRNAI